MDRDAAVMLQLAVFAANDAATTPISTTVNYLSPPPKKIRGASNKKIISKDTTTAYCQTIYRLTVHCYEHTSHEVSDNSGRR